MPDVTSERVWINAPAGRLAGELCYSSGRLRSAALLIPPHPYMGGRMKLPLLTALAETLAGHDIATLRFDYAGVGQSEGPRVEIGPAMQQFWNTGHAPEDSGRADEARAALAWLRANVAPTVALVGYSFGAAIATLLLDASVSRIVLIAPTVKQHDYSAFRNERTPTLIVYGDGDFATKDDLVRAWAARLPGATSIRHVQAGDHFFRGQEREVAGAVSAFLLGVPADAAEVGR